MGTRGAYQINGDIYYYGYDAQPHGIAKRLWNAELYMDGFINGPEYSPYQQAEQFPNRMELMQTWDEIDGDYHSYRYIIEEDRIKAFEMAGKDFMIFDGTIKDFIKKYRKEKK